jgi:hypothetical protein
MYRAFPFSKGSLHKPSLSMGNNTVFICLKTGPLGSAPVASGICRIHLLLVSGDRRPGVRAIKLFTTVIYECSF